MAYDCHSKLNVKLYNTRFQIEQQLSPPQYIGSEPCSVSCTSSVIWSNPIKLEPPPQSGNIHELRSYTRACSTTVLKPFSYPDYTMHTPYTRAC